MERFHGWKDLHSLAPRHRGLPGGETGGFGLRWYQSDKSTTEKVQESGGEVELAQFYP